MGKAPSFSIPVPRTRIHAPTWTRPRKAFTMRCFSGRFAFDFVHEDRLEPERLTKYRGLLLPNVAMLSDRQCQQIKDYVRPVDRSWLALKPSLYDENLNPRAEFRAR